MNRAIILFSTGEILDIKSRRALLVADTYLYSIYGDNYNSNFEILKATDNKGVTYSIFIEKG
jgi:hypothetical protein